MSSLRRSSEMSSLRRSSTRSSLLCSGLRTSGDQESPAKACGIALSTCLVKAGRYTYGYSYTPAPRVPGAH